MCCRIFAIIACILSVGCQTQSCWDSERLKRYLSRGGEEYIRLEPVSLSLLEEQADERRSIRMNLINGFANRIGSNVISSKEWMRMREMTQAIYQDEVRPLQEIRELSHRTNAIVFSYDLRRRVSGRSDFDLFEHGYITLERGRVAQKVTIRSGKNFERVESE
jgi:hypothetical protein